MPNYTVTNTFLSGEISPEKYASLWRGIIERAEKNFSDSTYQHALYGVE